MFMGTFPLQLQAILRPLIAKIGYKGAAYVSHNYAWGGGLNTMTQCWTVSCQTGDNADVIYWESFMNDGGQPVQSVLETHMRNSLLQKRRPVYHLVHAGKCDSKEFRHVNLFKSFQPLNDHYW